MEWDDAVRASPRAEAWRVIQDGQLMYVDEEGIVSADIKPNYALSAETDDSPWDFDDWRSVGLSKEELEERIHDIADLEVEFGLLAPDGIFYRCDYREHQLLAESVAHHLVHWIKEREKNAFNRYTAAEDDIVEAGWAVLKFNQSYNSHGGRWLWPDKWTQSQLDAAWDRWAATGDKLPYQVED